MKFVAATFVLFLFCRVGFAQEQTLTAAEPKSVTVPAAIDHNRIVINVDIALPDGSTKTIHAWVDNGNPDLEMSRRLATLLGLTVTCSDNGVFRAGSEPDCGGWNGNTSV